MNKEKKTIKLLTKLINLTNEDLVLEVLKGNFFISNLAKEELIRRNPVKINLSNDKLDLLIKKFSIEDIWFLVSYNTESELATLAYLELTKILDYYDMIEAKEKQKEKLYLIK